MILSTQATFSAASASTLLLSFLLLLLAPAGGTVALDGDDDKVVISALAIGGTAATVEADAEADTPTRFPGAVSKVLLRSTLVAAAAASSLSFVSGAESSDKAGAAGGAERCWRGRGSEERIGELSDDALVKDDGVGRMDFVGTFFSDPDDPEDDDDVSSGYSAGGC
jgi:hypothetical protein